MKYVLLLIMICFPFLVFSQAKKSNASKTKLVKINQIDLDSIKNQNTKFRDSIISLNSVNKTLKEVYAQRESNAKQTVQNVDSVLILNQKMDSLQKLIILNEKSNPILEKIRNENKKLKDSIVVIIKKQEDLKDENYILGQEKATNNSTIQDKEAKISAKDIEIQKLKDELAKREAILKENSILMNSFVRDINNEINLILLAPDMLAQTPKINSINSKIENLINSNKGYINSFTVYSDKLKWYQDMTEAIEDAKKILGEKYETKKITIAITKLEAVQNSVITKPTSEQNKIIETQKSLLKDYCGRHNYVVGKMNDANYFEADKVGAIEEIDAALIRTDKGYSFLIKELEKRRKDPSNKALTLERVNCPKE